MSTALSLKVRFLCPFHDTEKNLVLKDYEEWYFFEMCKICKMHTLIKPTKVFKLLNYMFMLGFFMNSVNKINKKYSNNLGTRYE